MEIFKEEIVYFFHFNFYYYRYNASSYILIIKKLHVEIKGMHIFLSRYWVKNFSKSGIQENACGFYKRASLMNGIGEVTGSYGFPSKK